MQKFRRIIIILLSSFSIFFAQNYNHNKFHNTLLIINFNHPYYDNIPFLKEIYAPFFSNMIFYGEKAHNEVVSIRTEKGHYVSNLIFHVLETNPGYEGYLFLEDDCILNLWNCLSLDLDKIWLLPGFTLSENAITTSHFITVNVASGKWSEPWGWPWRLESVRNAFQKLSPKDKEYLTYNLGKDIAIATAADMFYFPGKYREDVMRLCPIFEDVFIETAMPCILAALDFKEKWEKVSILFGVTSMQVHHHWPMEQTCIHPVKLSDNNNRDSVRKLYKRMFPGIPY